jgi:hypothetical protein
MQAVTFSARWRILAETTAIRTIRTYLSSISPTCPYHTEGSHIVLAGEFRIQITKRAYWLRHICMSCSLHSTPSVLPPNDF